jgi:hypothetical protein
MMRCPGQASSGERQAIVVTTRNLGGQSETSRCADLTSVNVDKREPPAKVKRGNDHDRVPLVVRGSSALQVQHKVWPRGADLPHEANKT